MNLLKFLIILLNFIHVNCSAGVVVKENDILRLECQQENTGLNIESAEWTYDQLDLRNWFMPKAFVRNLAFTYGKLLGMCSYDEATTIRGICQGQRNCYLKVDRRILGDDCVYWMELKVTYSCEACTNIKRTKRGIQIFGIDIDHIVPDYSCALGRVLPDHNVACPNNRFIAKHICTRCRDDIYGAAIFATQVDSSRHVSITSSTVIQSVFITPNNDMTYHENNPYCIFDRPTSKYDCIKRSSGWDCTYMGQIIAAHYKYTGHYDHNLDNAGL